MSLSLKNRMIVKVSLKSHQIRMGLFKLYVNCTFYHPFLVNKVNKPNIKINAIKLQHIPKWQIVIHPIPVLRYQDLHIIFFLYYPVS